MGKYYMELVSSEYDGVGTWLELTHACQLETLVTFKSVNKTNILLISRIPFPTKFHE